MSHKFQIIADEKYKKQLHMLRNIIFTNTVLYFKICYIKNLIILIKVQYYNIHCF